MSKLALQVRQHLVPVVLAAQIQIQVLLVNFTISFNDSIDSKHGNWFSLSINFYIEFSDELKMLC